MMFGGQNNDVFELLEKACLYLAGSSSKKIESEGKLSEHLVYKRLVWGML